MPIVAITLHISADAWADLQDEETVAEAIDECRRDASLSIAEMAQERSGGGPVEGTVYTVAVYRD